MKQLLFLVLFLPGMYLYALNDEPVVPVVEEPGLIKFQEVVDEKGTKEKLFNRSIYWLNDYYTNPTRVTTIRDFQSGRIEGRHNFRIYYYADDSVKNIAGTVDYVFDIEFKTDKYRYTITHLKLRAETRLPVEKWLNKDDPGYNKRWDEYLKQMADFFEEWSSNLKTKMKPEKEKAADDW